MKRKSLLLIGLACILLKPIPTHAAPNSVLMDELNKARVFYMDFDNNKLFDRIGEGLYTSSSNKYSFVEGVKSNGILLNRDSFTVNNVVSKLSNKSSITISFWIKYGGDDNASADEFKKGIIPISFGDYNLWIRNECIGFNTSNNDVFGTKNNLKINEWNHIIAEFNKGDVTKNKLYINGVKQILSQQMGVSNNARTNITDLTIGAWIDKKTHLIESSVLDEIVIFDKSLTDSELKILETQHQIPDLKYNIGQYVDLIWTTEMLDEDVLWETGFEDGDYKPSGLPANCNAIDSGEYYSGLKSARVKDSSTAGVGNFKYPAQENWTSRMVYSSILGLKPGMKFSASVKIKNTGSTASISLIPESSSMIKNTAPFHSSYGIAQPIIVGADTNGSSFIPIENFDYFDEQMAKKGNYVVFVANKIGRNYDASCAHIYPTNIDKAKRGINFGAPTYYKKGEQLQYVFLCYPLSLAGKTIEKSDEWITYNFNGTMNDFGDNYDIANKGIKLIFETKNTGSLYIDDFKLGHATKVRLYRDGGLIYEGYDSMFQDKLAVDKTNPNNVSSLKIDVSRNVTKNTSNFDINYNTPKDLGSTYKYNISAVDKTNVESSSSESHSATVLSGIKGYSYVIDKNPTTIPDNTVDTTSNNIEAEISDKVGETYYFHIKTIDNAGNVSSVLHKKIDTPILNVEPKHLSNMIRLDWSMDDVKYKTFKVYQKKPGSESYQSVSATDFKGVDKVNVLNIYPVIDIHSSTTRIPTETFTNWEGKQFTLPQSARLKKWMEEPNAENPKGYGKGIISVDGVGIDEFNLNPDKYLKNADGTYKYNVIMLGSWDYNGNRYGNADMTQAGATKIQEFVDAGYGLLIGHDVASTINPILMNQFKDDIKVEIKGLGNVEGTKIAVKKKGALTNYPWSIDSQLTIPYTHTQAQVCYGDIWLEFNTTAGATDGNGGYTNSYLTTNNNIAMIQTGHSRGQATPDEQKILANTLFYLNQLNDALYLDDYSGQDITSPEKTYVNILSSSSLELKFNFDRTKDLGSDYSYYVSAQDKDSDETLESNIVSTTITTGIKGFSYILDQNPSTIPSDSINHTSGDLTISNIKSDSTYYLHVKAIDKAGNVGEVNHFKVVTNKPLAPSLNLSRTGWGTDNVTFNISQQHNKNLNIVSIGNYDKEEFINKLKAFGCKVTEKKGSTDIEDLLKYDVIVLDGDVWGVHSASTLKTLYDRGAKIITIGNDTLETIYPIKSVVPLPANTDLTINRSIKNEATFNLPTLGEGRESKSYSITGIVDEAKVLYKDKIYNNPAIIEINNSNGGRWIHSQKVLGHSDAQDAKELVLGLVDYITNSISQVHVSDVQYKINNGSWTSYNGGDIPITQEGSYDVSVRNIDNRGVASDVVIKTVGIDRTAPYLTATAPATTQSRTVNVSLTNMGDSLSGIKQVRLSNYSDFRDATAYTNVSGNTSTSVSVTIPFLSDLNQNYSTRTIYVQLLDNVGNSKIITCNTKYEAKPPQVPVLVSPKKDSLYRDKERVNITWIYNDINNDGVKLPQSKAIVNLKNTLTGKAYTYVINNSETDFTIGNIDDGVYDLSVQVFNSLGKSATSATVTFRYNVFSSSGYLLSKSIDLSTPVSYINVASSADLPLDTKVDGYIYYVSKNTEAFSENKKVKFEITSEITNNNVIKLPAKSPKIMVRWNLYSQNTNKLITPAIADIVVYGR